MKIHKNRLNYRKENSYTLCEEVKIIEKHYLKATDLYREALRRKDELEKVCVAKERALLKMPPGKIHIVRKGKRLQYYLRKNPADKSGKYIPKSNISTIRTHLQKSYDEDVLKLVKKEINILEKFLSNSDSIISQIRQLYSSKQNEIKELITPIDCSDEEYAEKWLKEPFQTKGVSEDLPHYITENGEYVRSKSELNIANALFKRGIPYKYECPLFLQGNQIIYPDFTVLHVRKRKVVYWEHRGMMDDREYAKYAVKRIKLLNAENIWQGYNLMITEETATNPLGTDEIDNIIQKYFMS